MKWRQESPWLVVSDAGYKVAKFVVGTEAKYRASAGGQAIGGVVDSFVEAKNMCERHSQTAGQDREVAP